LADTPVEGGLAIVGVPWGTCVVGGTADDGSFGGTTGVVDVGRLFAATVAALEIGDGLGLPETGTDLISRGANGGGGAPAFALAIFESRVSSLFSITETIFWTVSKAFSSSRILLTMSSRYRL
jgi:hypothetical protein